jgi:GTPase SAR1 family protein
MARSICPYCFEILSSGHSFRCASSQCAPEPDVALARYRRLPAMLEPPVFRSSAHGGKARCACGVTTLKRVCEACHNDLPGQFGQTDSFTIGLIGARAAGKSNYIAVLIHELANRVGQRFGAAMSALDEQTIKRYKDEFRRYVYDKHEIVPKTLSGATVRYPLVYRLSLPSKGLLFTKLRVVTLVFFDTAGESLDDLDAMSTETKYIANSDGLIFLLDPLQIPAVRDQLRDSAPLPEETTDPVEIIGRVIDLVRRSKDLGPTRRIATPVALAFSKIDVVRRLVDPGSPLERASNHDGYLDLTDVEEMNDAMRAYVRDEWVGPNFDTLLQHNFEKSAFFGLSSFGGPPRDGRLPKGVSPFRVEDPLLWLLHDMGVIRGQRRKQ